MASRTPAILRHLVNRVKDLVSARRQNQIDRDAYWAAMREHHRSLSDYQELVEAAGLASIEITSAGLLVCFKNGARIAWDPDELRSPPAVLLNDGAYEETEWRVIETLGTTARTVLDVGAHIGWYAIRLAAVRGNRPGVHAFEPLPETYQHLARNVELNGFGARVLPHAIGLGERDEVVTFFVPSHAGSVAASQRVLFEHERYVTVDCRVRSLDDVARELELTDIDFVKCDIEGGELAFLRGAGDVLAHQRPSVLLEMLRKWSRAFGYHPNDVIEWMRRLEYVCAALSHETVVRITEVTEETPETNFLFVHADRVATVARALAPVLARVELD